MVECDFYVGCNLQRIRAGIIIWDVQGRCRTFVIFQFGFSPSTLVDGFDMYADIHVIISVFCRG